MKEYDEIRRLIEEDQYDKALARLDHAIEVCPSDSVMWYERGRLYWRLGNKADAISDFEEALYLDRESPARHALQLARDVMDFYNTDLLNP